MLDLRHSGAVVRTLIPKIAEGIFNVICKFSETNEYVLYYHSGRKTLRVFRVSDGVMVANYRVPSDLSSLESTLDGNSVVLGMVDGNLTVLTIADPKKPHVREYLRALPSRNPGQQHQQQQQQEKEKEEVKIEGSPKVVKKAKGDGDDGNNEEEEE